jgi:type II secretion system protein D
MRSMKTRRRNAALLAILVIAGVAGTVRAAADDVPPAEPPPIRFTFKGATFEQVIDFFGRATGMPVVWESPPPEGTLDYVSPESYAVPDALRVLNIILQSRGVMLRVDDGMLYLQKLTEMQREDVPTYVGTVPAEITSDQIITVVLPLQRALAAPLAERLAQMVATYGSVAALPQPNAIVITETAAQVRRLMKIVEELDREDPDGAVEIVPLKYARAATLMAPLTSLLSKTVERIVLDQKNQPQRVTQEEMSGIAISFDERTNAIIARGVQGRIDKLKEAIALLDVPAIAHGREIRTFALARLAPADAKTKLDQMFTALPETDRPQVVPLEETGRVTVVGAARAIEEAGRFLADVDGGAGASPGDGQTGETIAVVAIERADAASLASALGALLSRRQQAVVKVVPAPDGSALLVSGPAADVASVRSVVPLLDVRARPQREVRVLRLAGPGAERAVQRAIELDRRRRDPADGAADPDGEVEAELDAEARTLTLIGTGAALDRFAQALRVVEGAVAAERETRRIGVTSAQPSAIAGPLATLAAPLLRGPDGTAAAPPEVVAVDALDLLVVTARPGDFAVIESVVEALDRPAPGDFAFRVVPLPGVERPDDLVARATDAFTRMTAGYVEGELPAPAVEIDSASGSVVLSGRRESVQRFEAALAEARSLLPPARTGRLHELHSARAADVAEALAERWRLTADDPAGRAIPEPRIEVLERTNALYVVAEQAQHEAIERGLRELDTHDPGALPPLRLIQVRAADAAQLAAMLRARYDARPAEQRRTEPVAIDADAATNTLIVTAPDALYEEVRAFVASVNDAEKDDAQRQTMLFSLQRARATDLAAALEKLYPEPPMPLDRRGQPMPHLRPPREVYVSADAATNTLIVEAPGERRASFESLVEQLDRVELPPRAMLRTFPIERGDPAEIARTLQELALRGVLSEQPPDGSKPVEVLVQVEPKSRTLIVAGDERTFSETERILRDLQAVQAPRGLRVFEVTGIDPQELADRAQRLYAEQTAGAAGLGPVSVEVDRERGVLLAVAEDEAMFRFATILAELEATALPPPEVRLVALEHADAAEVTAYLRDLAQSHFALAGGRIGAAPTFEAIERTNSIMVAAQRDVHEIVRVLVQQLDRVEPKDMPPLRILQLRSADAENLAGALMRQYAARSVEERNAKPVTISADPQTNALIVAAHPDVLPEIEGIVGELNLARRQDGEGREIRIFPLEVARAEDLARTLDEMFPPPPVPVDRSGRPMPHLQPAREVVVRADAQTNSIIVDAPIQRMAGFEQLVAQLDRARLAEETEIRTYRIVNAELPAVAQTLERLAQGGALVQAAGDRRTAVTVTTEPVTRTLIVSGPAAAFVRIEEVIESLDGKPAGPATALRFFRLQHAAASEIADLLREVLLARIAVEMPGATATNRALLEVTAEPRSNTVIVSAPQALLTVAEELVRQLDDPAAAAGAPMIRVRPLVFADAAEVSRALAEVIPGQRNPETGRPLEVRIVAAPGSSALVLVGAPADLEAVEALIAPLDAHPAGDAADARTFRLEHADATAVAPMVQRLLVDLAASDPRGAADRARRARGGGAAAPVRVESDARTNSLVVSGPKTAVLLAESVVAELDRADDAAARTVRAYAPKRADPATLAAGVSAIIEAAEPAAPRRARIVAERGSGAILVVGAELAVEQALTLLAERDVATLVAPQVDLAIVDLAHADAAAAAPAVQALLADRARWPEELRAFERAGIAVAQPTVTADASRNRLLISAPQALLSAARTLVGELDRPAQGGAVDVRVFGLAQADPAAAAEAIRAAMAARRSAQPSLPPVAVTAEAASSSLVVAAPAALMDEIAAIVERLDASVGGDQAQVRTIFLRRARAEVVAPIVERLLASEELPPWMRLDAMRWRVPMPESAPPVRVAADARLNAIIVTAAPAALNVAEQMIAQLDVDAADRGAPPRTVRLLVVRNADAAELATSLADLFAENEEGDVAPTIRVDRASNALLVRATDAQFAAMEELIGRLDDAAVDVARQIRTIAIDPAKASAEDVARALERLLDRREGGAGVEVIPLEDLLDRTKGEKRGQTPFPEDRDGGSAASGGKEGGLTPFRWLLAVAMGADPAAAEGGAPPDVTIAVDPVTNSIVIMGSPRAVERAAELAAQVEEELPPAPARVRIVALPREIDADATARLLSETLRRLPGLGARSAVFADRAGNALVVVATDVGFATIGDLLAALADRRSAQEVVVKLYPLQTIRADRAAERVRGALTPAGAEEQGPVALRLVTGAGEIEARFDPKDVAVSADDAGGALLVTAPPEALPFVDRYVEMIDLAPETAPATLELYPLHHARAGELEGTLRRLFAARAQGERDRGDARAVVPEFAAEARTNTLLVTASSEHLAEVDRLLADLDRELGEDIHPLRVVEMKAALPSRAAELLDKIVVGSDQRRRATTMIVPDDNSGVLLVRASAEVSAEIDTVLTEIDRDAAREFPVRTITLERAAADAVASALQRFFDDRARIASAGRGRREQARRVSIIGDRNSRTILVAASDEDFAQIETLVAQFDTPQATDAWTFRVVNLKHAKATDVQETLQNLINDLTWGQGPMFWWGGGMESDTDQRGTIAVHADVRLNALIITGEGDKFDVVEGIVAILDAPKDESEARVVRLYRLEHGDASVAADLIEELYTDADRRWWEDPDPTEARVRLDRGSNTVIVSASAREQEEIAALVASLDAQVAPAQRETVVVPVQFAEAGELARTLGRFLQDRARSAGGGAPAATIAASESARALVVSAPAEEMATIRDLVARLDQPDVSGDRVVEIVALEEGDAEEIARIVREQFARGSGAAGTGVVVTPDARTNSLIVNAPQQQSAQALALIDRLDTRGASDETIIRTYSLAAARAADAVQILEETLQLDAKGRTEGISIKLDEASDPVEVQAKITADTRSNSLVVTATAESFPVIESLIRRLDEVPAVSPVEYRIIPLEHALADDVALTLELVGQWRDDPTKPRFDYNRRENQLIVAATADQLEQIMKILDEVDRPSSRERITDFVPLQFAEAEKIQEALSVFYGTYAYEADTPAKRNVRIVADTATNSLVITADEAEWTDIRALLAKLDSAEYDASLQLEVIALRHAGAASVAQAINDAFQGRVERDRGGRGAARPRGAGGPGANGEGGGGAGGAGDERRDPQAPAVLIESEEWVRAAAEEATNSVIVSASRPNIRKIQGIIAQLDVAEHATLPPPRLVPVTTGDPAKLAESITRLYEERGERRRRVLVVGDALSSTLIVRADEEEFRQIETLAAALQQETAAGGVSVEVIRLASAPATRVAEAVREAFTAKAARLDQPFSIEVDAPGNAIVVAAGPAIVEEVRATVAQLDALAPAAGQGIFIIELEHVAPDAAKSIIETIGLDKPVGPDAAARLVSEPIKVAPLAGRSAIVVIANPADRATIVGLLKAIDAEPALGTADVRVVRLHRADAASVAGVLEQILAPGDQQAQTPLARAVAEQVRRLRVHRDGLGDHDLDVDLTKPVRVVVNEGLNAVVIASTTGNVAALADLVAVLDDLPLTEAVTVQIFPLENVAAEQFARVVRELFEQGRGLRELPGTDRPAMPGGMVGAALGDAIAITTDPRTNTVIVAGREDSVALVEVLKQRLDGDVGSGGWVEPRIVKLTHADATALAETLDAILVRNATADPQTSPIQQQIGRLRMARLNENGGAILESDVFVPMTRLIIRPEPQLNAIVLVGTPANVEVVGELIAMLDVPAAAPDATVRIYPVRNASASRIAGIITNLFDQQVQSKAIRPEDRVIVQADERTNSIIVTTSPRSFAVLESLLATLDTEIAPDLREIRRIDVEHASSTRLATLIQQLMDARLERLRRVQPETADLERATVIADPRTNSLIVAAGNESFAVIKDLAAQLDRAGEDGGAIVEVIDLDHASGDRVAEVIDQVMERRYAEVPEEIRASQAPLVIPDPRTSSLLVAANPEDLAAIVDLVAKLEAAPADPAVGLHVVQVPQSAQAEQIAPRLQRIMRERQQAIGGGQRPGDAVTIEPDPSSNTLIVAASDENVEVVRGLVDLLVRAESEAAAGRLLEIITLQSSRADDMATLLHELYVTEANRRRGPGTVTVTADDRANAVIVSAPPSDLSEIRQLVARLDGTKPASVLEIKYVALESANALEMVSLIQNVLGGRGIGARGSPRQATVLKYLQEIERAESGEVAPPDGDGPQVEVSAAIRESIVLTPDLRTNTIIVSAPAAAMGMIERMIRDLDATSTGAKSIRVFTLKNADATALREVVINLFNLRQSGNLLVLKPREDGEGAGLDVPGAPAIGGDVVGGIDGADLTAVPDERQQLSITVDSRTNSLLVSGTPAQLDLVADVVERLDALEANEREVFVRPLRNAVAADVARVIGDFVREEQEKLVSTLGADQLGSAARLLEREVTIHGDAQSNTVLVSASPRYAARMRGLIDELDVDPAQVLIQVMLAEVTLDGTDVWGFEMSGEFDVGHAAVSAGFGFASTFVPGMGVPQLSIASSDFSLIFRALQTQGRLQVLSNPSIMAANNQVARIQVGETIRVPEDTTFADGDTNTSTIERELGVILEVTPSINPDGFVRLQVAPEISNLSSRTTQINENLESPVITIRTAETTVTVHDGQTIVIGGLISDRHERRDRKVPFLGDIPLVGVLFRSATDETMKTELLIVLTPHVIESPTDFGRVDELTGREIRRLTLPQSIKDRIREGVFDLGSGLFDAEGNPIEYEFEGEKP